MKWLILPLLLCPFAPAQAQEQAASAQWQWRCRVLEPYRPTESGELLFNFDRTEGQVFIKIESETFPDVVTERQLRQTGSVYADVGEPAEEAPPTTWIVQSAAGRRAIEVVSHGSRNGDGTAIMISSYSMTTIGSLPDDLFEYHAVGLCRTVRNIQ